MIKGLASFRCLALFSVHTVHFANISELAVAALLLCLSLFSFSDELPETGTECGVVNQFILSTSLYTKHFHPKPEHNNKQELIGIEYQRGESVWGGAIFKNSFHQDSQLIYWAKEFSLSDSLDGFRSKWLFGFLHGYKGKYKNKIPLNQLGIAPAVLPTLGYSNRYFEVDVMFLGISAITVTAGIPIRL